MNTTSECSSTVYLSLRARIHAYMLSWVIPAAKCRQLIKILKRGLQLRVQKVMWICTRYSDFFPKQDLYYVNHIFKQLCSIASQFTGECSNLNLSLPLYLLKLNIENELNDALPFNGDLASMKTFKSNQKG